jgi:flagellin-like protein
MYEKFKSRVLKRMGVSPVIATLLLILIAVAAAVLVYLWVSGYVGTATRAQPEMEEKLKIEAVQGATSGATAITCYVRNVGGVDAVLVNAYLQTGGVVLTTGSVNTTIKAGTTTAVPVTVGLGTSLIPGVTYTIKLVTRTGVETSYMFRVAG